MQARVISAWQPNMKTRRTINVDRDQAGQLCTKESVFMQMTLSKMPRKESNGDGSHSQLISREDAEGLFKGITTALPTVNEGTRQKRLRRKRNLFLNFRIFLVLYSRLQRFFCPASELNRVSFV